MSDDYVRFEGTLSLGEKLKLAEAERAFLKRRVVAVEKELEWSFIKLEEVLKLLDEMLDDMISKREQEGV